jgi:hypothetical protein
MDLKETELEDVDWMHLAKDKDQWQALVNILMNLGSHNRKEFSD